MTGRGPLLVPAFIIGRKNISERWEWSGKETSPQYLHWEPLTLLFVVVVVVVVVVVFVVSYPFFQGAKANMTT